jgi:hypothetical protein
LAASVMGLLEKILISFGDGDFWVVRNERPKQRNDFN